MRTDRVKYLVASATCLALVASSVEATPAGTTVDGSNARRLCIQESSAAYAMEARASDFSSDEVRGVSVISDAARFRILADDWRQRTRHESSISRAILHPSHIKIIRMDKETVLKMIFPELRDRGGHWYWALQHLTEVTDIGERGDGLEVVKAKWLQWGREHGYLSA